jgi:serine protease Do
MTVGRRPQLLAYPIAALIMLPAITAADGWRGAIAERAKGSVVAVIPDVPRQAMNMEEPEGTGFAVGDGKIVLTADHVLGKANAARLRLKNGAEVDAEVLVRDADTDIALLSISNGLAPLEFGAAAKTGDDVCISGNAFGLGISLTCGIVSATSVRGTGFNRVEDFVQTDAAMNPGMSGAPLFTKDGKVAGMASAIFTKDSDGNLGVNFAASARLLEAFLADAQDRRIDRRPQGLLLRPAVAEGGDGAPKAEIVRVVAGSPEAAAGIKSGDVLEAVNGLAVGGQPDYLFAIMLFSAIDAVRFTIVRDGDRFDIEVDASLSGGKER